MIHRRTALFGGGVALAGMGAGYAGLRRMGSMADYTTTIATTRAALADAPAVADCIGLATLAPSGHNTQPWRFRADPSGVAILPDFARRTPLVDPDDHHLFVSLGCAAENLALAARARGHAGELTVADDGSVAFAFGGQLGAEPALARAIPQRQSTRAEYDGAPIPAADLLSLAAAAVVPGVDLVLITDRPGIDRVRDLVVEGNRMQMADPAFIRELKAWLRFSPRQAILTGDGLFSAASGNPPLPAWLGPTVFDWVFRTDAEGDKYARQIDSSAGIAVFVAKTADPAHWVAAGRACQRFALQATGLGLKCAFINQPVEVVSLRPELAANVGLPGRRPDIVMRVGYGPTLPFSARRPVKAVLA